jgi:hypothetical protein
LTWLTGEEAATAPGGKGKKQRIINVTITTLRRFRRALKKIKKSFKIPFPIRDT